MSLKEVGITAGVTLAMVAACGAAYEIHHAHQVNQIIKAVDAERADARDLGTQGSRALAADKQINLVPIQTRIAQDETRITSKPAPAPGAPLVVHDPADQALVADLQAEVATLQDKLAQAETAATAYQGAYTKDDDALGKLRTVVHPEYSRAVGLIYGSNQTAGIFVDQDISRVRLGVEVFTQNISALAGGKAQTTVVFRAGVRF